MFGTILGWTPEVPFYPPVNALPASNIQGELRPFPTLYVLDKFPCSRKRLTRRKLLCLRSEERAFAAEARVPVAHPTAVLIIRARLVTLVVGAVCRISTISDTVSTYRVPAV